jgi:hypothetical protein
VGVSVGVGVGVGDLVGVGVGVGLFTGGGATGTPGFSGQSFQSRHSIEFIV